MSKFTYLILSLLVLTIGIKSDQIESNRTDNQDSMEYKLSIFNQTIMNILEATLNSKIQDGNHTSEIKNLWNLIDPLVRLALLNQTDVQKFWNVTEELTKNNNKLDWKELPDEVKKFLMKQFQENRYLNITFNEWGWSKYDSPFASTNLYFLLSQEQIDSIPLFESIINKISFDQLINTTAIKDKFYSHHRILINVQNNENFIMDLPYFDFPLREFTLSSSQPSTFAVYSQGLGNLISFLIQIKYFL